MRNCMGLWYWHILTMLMAAPCGFGRSLPPALPGSSTRLGPWPRPRRSWRLFSSHLRCQRNSSSQSFTNPSWGPDGARPFGHPNHSTPSQLMEKFENCDCMLRYSIRLYFEIRCKVQYLTWCSDPRQAGECFYTSKYWGSSHAPGLVLENLAKLTKPSISGFTSSSMNKQLCSQGGTEFVFQIWLYPLSFISNLHDVQKWHAGPMECYKFWK